MMLLVYVTNFDFFCGGRLVVSVHKGAALFFEALVGRSKVVCVGSELWVSLRALFVRETR